MQGVVPNMLAPPPVMAVEPNMLALPPFMAALTAAPSPVTLNLLTSPVLSRDWGIFGLLLQIEEAGAADDWRIEVAMGLHTCGPASDMVSFSQRSNPHEEKKEKNATFPHAEKEQTLVN
eukprot:432043-Rhodomonas_salina.1